MLTPVFRCRTDDSGKFIIVDIRLPSIHCKLSTAEFDITNNQFTFHCSPYYLRLTFSHWLGQGLGERATYNVEENVLSVYLPKQNAEDRFLDLDYPPRLLATRKQRQQMVVEMDDLPIRHEGNEMDQDEKGEEGAKKVADSDDESDPLSDDDIDAAEAETEFVQTTPKPWSDEVGTEEKDEGHSLKEQGRQQLPTTRYGFNYNFSHFFTNSNPPPPAAAASGSVAPEIPSTTTAAAEAFKCLPHPDQTSYFERKVLRMAEEEQQFDEDMVFFYTFFDEGKGEVEELIHNNATKPWYLAAFERALKKDGVSFVSAGVSHDADANEAESNNANVNSTVAGGVDSGHEEDETPAVAGGQQDGGGKVIVAWSGNVGTLEEPSLGTEENNNGEEQPQQKRKPLVQVMASFGPDGEALQSGGGRFLRRREEAVAGSSNLACPKRKPKIELTMDEADLLARIPQGAQQQHPATKKHPQAQPSQSLPSIRCLLVELLLAYVYDSYVTFGEGSTESLWNITTLSPSLSWLDTEFHLYDTLVTFSRRVLCFPQYRSNDLVSRCFRDVGVLLLCGRLAVVKCLLRIKSLLDHSSSQFCLSTLFINPLLEHLCTQSEDSVNTALELAAVEVHDYVAGGDGNSMLIQRPSKHTISGWTGSIEGLEGGSSGASVAVQKMLSSGKEGKTLVAGGKQEEEKVGPVGLPTLGLPFSAC